MTEGPFELVLRSRAVVTPEGIRPGTVTVRGGTIAAVLPADAALPPGTPVEDLGEAALLPGLVDAHAHLNEPGRTEWEGYETATRAAAAGGITTLVDMPLNCIPVTTSVAALEAKLTAVADHAHVDYALWGGVVPGNLAELAPMAARGVAGFKAFLVHSGIDDFPASTLDDLRAALPVLRDAGVPLLAHAELDPGGPEGGDPRRYASYLASRPPEMEVRAIAALAELAEATGAHAHVVHLSAADALPTIRAARARGVCLTVETCPHYLTLEAEAIPDGRTEYKCAPPIRGRENRERLWQGLLEGTIDQVVSDHSPCTPQLKLPAQGDFLGAWGGIASLQLGLPLVWTEARARGVDLARVVAWMAERPARLAGLPRKGAIASGRDADLVVFDPDAEHAIAATELHHRHPVTPYLGRRVRGAVRRTYLRGRLVWDGRTFPAPPSGRHLRRAVP